MTDHQASAPHASEPTETLLLYYTGAGPAIAAQCSRRATGWACSQFAGTGQVPYPPEFPAATTIPALVDALARHQPAE